MNQIFLPRCLQPWRSDLVRLGNAHGDTGYLVNPRDIEKSHTLVSFGIGDNWMFEQQFQDMTGCEVLCWDKPTDRLIPGRDDFFQGNRKLTQLAVTENGHVDTIMLGLEPGVFLKCDIEGSEWSIMDALLQHRNLYTGIVIEVHYISSAIRMDQLLDFICRIGMPLVHLHVNNWFYYCFQDSTVIPDTFELTFSTDMNVTLDRDLALPHPMDKPNNPKNPEFTIEWFTPTTVA